MDEADDDLNTDDQTSDTGVEGGLDLGGDESNSEDMPTDEPAEDEDALDLDSLADDDMGDQGQMDTTFPQPNNQPPQSTQPTDMGDNQMDTSGEPTDEIDVTQFVEKGTELTQKVDTQVQELTQQITMLAQKVGSMDSILGKIQQVEDQINAMRPPKPIETLKLRSLDSYPYNQGIDDYWKNKEIEIEKLRDFNRVDNQEYVLTNDDVNNYSDIDIKDSLIPTKQSNSPFQGAKTNQQIPSSVNKQRDE